MNRGLRVVVTAAAAAFCLAGHAHAEEYPIHRITAVVALAAGGSMDVITRLYGQKLSEQFDQPFIVENRGAANGNLGAEMVAHAKPDGYTLLVASSGVYAINGSYFKELPYDPAKDFTPIALYAKIPFILVTSVDSPLNSIADLVKAAKAEPGKLTFASTGIGSAPHLAGELFLSTLGIQLTHVPYKGSMAQANTDVMARHVDFVFSDPSLAIPLIKAGKLKAFGTTSLTRLPQLPELPTIAEATGSPNFEAVSWHVISAPANTPKPIVDKLYGSIAEAFKDPVVVEKISDMGLSPVNPPLGSDATKAYVDAETVKWGALLERLHLTHVQ
jgi:tripartite-type tricarboxylate transporter receptor subunit TctC